jgi:hypothetical protein
MIKEMVKGEKEKMLERNLYIHNKTAGDQSRQKIYRLVHASMGTEQLCVPSLVLVECVHAELLTYCQIQSTKLDFNRRA